MTDLILPTDFRLDGPKRFGDEELDLLTLPPKSDLADDCSLWLILSETEFIYPVALVGLLALLDRFSGEADDRQIKIVLPADLKVLSYLADVEFIEALKSMGEVTGGGVDVLDSMGDDVQPIFPVQVVDQETSIDDLIDEIVDKFRKSTPSLASLADACQLLFSELAMNAWQHSGCERVWVVGQHYSKRKEIVIAIADSGIGIPSALRQNAAHNDAFTTDVEAITLALKDGVSGVLESHRGYGLGHVVRTIGSADRTFQLRSGQGHVTVRSTGVYNQLSVQTQLVLSPLSRHLQADNLYPERTVMYYRTADFRLNYATREMAKALFEDMSSNLTFDAAVTIDWERVQFISPSFADEIVSLLENLDTTVTFVGGSQLLWERFSEVIERRGANIPLDSDPTRYTVYA